MNILYIALLFFVVVLVFPFGYKVNANYSFSNNLGSFAFSLWKINLKLFIFSIQGKDIVIKTKKYRKEVEISLTNEQIRYAEQLIIQLKDKIKFKVIASYTKIGVENDACNSALFSGFINEINSILFCYILSKKPYIKLSQNNVTTFNSGNIELGVNIKFSISIFELVYCLFMSLIITKRSDKYEGI